jgi:hypothetical protein
MMLRSSVLKRKNGTTFPRSRLLRSAPKITGSQGLRSPQINRSAPQASSTCRNASGIGVNVET